MVLDARFLAFVGVSALLIVIPGPDMALVAANALAGGRRAAFGAARGIGAGIAVWGAAAGLGVAAVMAASPAAFAALRIAGASYLVYLGVQSVRSRGHAAATTRRGGPFLQGLLGNLLNPKAAVIFLTIVPQFVRPGDPAARIVAMMASFEVMILVWLHLFGTGVARVGQALARRLRVVTGLVLVALGLRLAVARG
jgi:threonine/homoserine/homoserine lactone efflux protein